MKSSGNTYYDKMHRLGKFVTVGSILVFCGVPLVVCLYYGIMPKIGDLLLAYVRSLSRLGWRRPLEKSLSWGPLTMSPM